MSKLKLFRANDREDEIGDQPESDESDEDVFHGSRRLNFFARPRKGEHEGEEADGGHEVEEVSHWDGCVACMFEE